MPPQPIYFVTDNLGKVAEIQALLEIPLKPAALELKQKLQSGLH